MATKDEMQKDAEMAAEYEHDPEMPGMESASQDKVCAWIRRTSEVADSLLRCPGHVRALLAEVERLNGPDGPAARIVAAIEAEAAGFEARADALRDEGRSSLADQRRSEAALFRRAARIARSAGDAGGGGAPGEEDR